MKPLQSHMTGVNLNLLIAITRMRKQTKFIRKRILMSRALGIQTPEEMSGTQNKTHTKKID